MAYESVKQRYLAKFPQSHMMFSFGDFALWELRMQDAHLVLGFGQAYQARSSAPGQWQHQKPDKKS
jgi:putative heme iron utilization protein